MMKTTQLTSRRTILKSLGIAAAAVPVLSIIGCNFAVEDETSQTTTSNTDSSTDTNTETTTNTSNTSDSWASGGTDLITANFPDDDIFTTAAACSVALTEATTEGPCYFSVDAIEDISSGLSGLPMMLCLQLIDSNCNPLAGYEIEVWHCDTRGIYSADTSNSSDSSRFAGNFCTGGDQAAEQSTWFRGGAVTDSSGRVNFKSCFPGWYSGRTIHVHFKVKKNNLSSVISQFCFTDAFCDEICTTHPLYSSRGKQDTPTSGGRDNVFGSKYADFQFTTAQNSDGTLLAFKRIQIS